MKAAGYASMALSAVVIWFSGMAHEMHWMLDAPLMVHCIAKKMCLFPD